MACTLRTRTLIVLSDQGKEFPSPPWPALTLLVLISLPSPNLSTLRVGLPMVIRCTMSLFATHLGHAHLQPGQGFGPILYAHPDYCFQLCTSEK